MCQLKESTCMVRYIEEHLWHLKKHQHERSVLACIQVQAGQSGLRVYYLGLPQNVEHVIIDFELAMRQAFINAFPMARVHHCPFHFYQSLRRYVSTTFKGASPHQRKILDNLQGHLFLLPYIPAEFVPPIFMCWKRELAGTSPHSIAYMRYFDATYVGTQAPAIFPVESWTIFG
ncbi:hypothetical protein Ciccas_012508 [Cichlidogyrus casuarinus]|uniref:MULE transposase domain-containing protein n=1 Tax=Cichlidogyrus casuarinus TaxID=1844966 RepID=A0ABD2PNA5_9PLAT